MRGLQLSWLQQLCNLHTLPGAVHRAVACPANDWTETSPALAAALHSVGWQIRRNVEATQTGPWPLLQPESAYPGEIALDPVDDFPLPGAVYTDGSLSNSGGAAVWIPDTESAVTCFVPSASSSTECELVALCGPLPRPTSRRATRTDRLLVLTAIAALVASLVTVADPAVRPPCPGTTSDCHGPRQLGPPNPGEGARPR